MSTYTQTIGLVVNLPTGYVEQINLMPKLERGGVYGSR